MRITAWKNGKHQRSGTSYGLSINALDRDRVISRFWQTVIVVLPDGEIIESNIAKDSFWGNCPHLINRKFSRWFFSNNFAPWPPAQPPIFELRHRRNNEFVIVDT